MNYYTLKPGIESVTRHTDCDDNGGNGTYGITVIKYSDGRIQIQDDSGIEFFANEYTELPGDNGFIARGPGHEYILGA